MLLIGTRISTPVVDVGSFECPQCATECTYQLREAREWLTLYFIPVLKLGVKGQFVECDRCRGKFEPPDQARPQPADLSGHANQRQQAAPMIENPAAADQEDYVEALLVLVACEQGAPRGEKFETLRQTVAEVRGSEPTNDQLGTLIEQGMKTPFSAEKLSVRLNSLLSQENKIKTIVLVDELVRCPGASHPTGWSLLQSIAANLGFRPHELDALLGQLEGGGEPGLANE